jgi:hypothetical protein
MTYQSLDPLVSLEDLADILRRILSQRIGQENAISRSKILLLVHELPLYRSVSARKIREAVEVLRDQGVLVCNLSNGDGYYVAGSMEDYQEWRRLYASYAITILTRVRALDAVAEQTWGTSTLQERLL